MTYSHHGWMRFTLSLIIISSLAISVLPGCGGGSYSSPSYSSPSVMPGGVTTGGQGRLTIMLAQYKQANANQMAQQVRSRAMSLFNTSDIWFANDELGLAINYGHFQTHDEAEKAYAKVKQVYKQLETGPWQFAYIKELPEPDPPANQEWNLLNTTCEYTLEVGVYYDVPQKNYFNRKIDAVNAVKQLRDQGETAYFLHGPLNSHVYVGCFSTADVQKGRPNKDGVASYHFSPSVKRMQDKYPYYHEHGAKVYDIERDEDGKTSRIIRTSIMTDVNDVRRQLKTPGANY